MIRCVPESMHERHSRIGDGIHVRLLWRAHDDGVFVAVTDTKSSSTLTSPLRLVTARGPLTCFGTIPSIPLRGRPSTVGPLASCRQRD